MPADFDKTFGFYTGVLGFKEKSRMKVDWPPMREIVFVELNDSVIEFLRIDNPAPDSKEPMQAGYVRIALEVEVYEQKGR